MEAATWLSAIGTWVGAAVVLGSVYFLRRTIRSTSTHTIYAMWMRVDEFFASNPDLKSYFYKNKKLDSSTDEKESNRIDAAAELMLDCMANVFDQLPNLGPAEREAYGNFLKERYKQIVLKQYLDENADWYTNSFVEFLRSESTWVINKKKKTSDK